MPGPLLQTADTEARGDGVEDNLVSEDEARRTAGDALEGRGRVGAVASRHGPAYVFEYHPYPGAGARTPEGTLVTVTPLDGDHVRVQVAGVTVAARARVRREEAAAGDTGHRTAGPLR